MSQPRRVLHLITSLGVGGVQNQLAKVVSSYDRESFTPSVCCLSDKGEIGGELEQNGLEVQALGEEVAGFNPRLLLRLYRLLRAEKVSILRAHKYRSAFYGVLAGRMAKVPAIVPSFHLPQAVRKPRRRLMIRLLALLSDEVVAVSYAVKENLVDSIGIPRSKVKVIHNGVDLTDFQNLPSKEEAKRRLGVPPDRLVIGAVGRMKAQKGYSFLLQALPLLKEGGLSNFWVIMVGEGEARSSLEREARDLGCGEKVHFLGMRRDVPFLLRGMDVFAFPSLWEGFGTSLVEAMAAEVPAIASDLPCVREIIPDERYGLLVPPRDVQALAEGILEFRGDGKLRESVVEAAKDRAFQSFSLGKVVSAYQDLFREVLARKGTEEGIV